MAIQEKNAYIKTNAITIITRVFIKKSTYQMSINRERTTTTCWDLRLEKLSKSSSKIMIAAEGVESKYSTELKHQE